MLYCPRCDERIEPGHRCLSRRFFLGALVGAASAIVVPKLAIAEPVAQAGVRAFSFQINGLKWESLPHGLLAGDIGALFRRGPFVQWSDAPLTEELYVVDEQEQH